MICEHPSCSAEAIKLCKGCKYSFCAAHDLPATFYDAYFDGNDEEHFSDAHWLESFDEDAFYADED